MHHPLRLISRGYETTFCRKDVPEIQCWNFPSTAASFRKSTRLYEISSARPDVVTSPFDNNMVTVNRTYSSNDGAFWKPKNGSTFNNGASEDSSTGHSSRAPMNGHVASTTTKPSFLAEESLSNDNGDDVPQPTVNGGFTHTKASRAKIGAANKGKTPWNKGKHRSEEVKARIAAGVRAKNRERFLEKLREMGLTEEEYEAQKKEERREKDEERRARRTPKGGYIPTDETRAKISKILKEKHARGEIRPRSVDPSKIRKGFTHSEETRNKISESLKQRWATDLQYRERMQNVVTSSSKKEVTRQRISETLKKKWKDPDFRAEMLARISASQKSCGPHDQERRERISQALKEKWKDAEYREKTLKAIQARQAKMAGQVRVKKPKVPKAPATKVKGLSTTTSTSSDDVVRMIQPLTKADIKSRKEKVVQKKKKKTTIPKPTKENDGGNGEHSSVRVKPMIAKKKTEHANTEKETKPATKEKEPDGSVNRLKEERRDLFDLLYGDENFDDDDYYDEDRGPSVGRTMTSIMFSLGDEDLDSFDPYGLDDY